MSFLGFDPGATVSIGVDESLAEVTLERDLDGRLVLRGETDDGRPFSVSLRADFFDALVAARAREAAA